MDLNTLPLPELFSHFWASGLVQRLLELARDEDLGPNPDAVGDVSSRATILPGQRRSAKIVARRDGIVAGLPLLQPILDTFRSDADATPHAHDSDHVHAGQTVATISGNLRAILAAERTMLNFLGRLSGVATRTRAVADLVRHTPTRILDTRKTTPGLRLLEKYAVRCGGGFCHRIGLHDAALIKDNHLAGVPLDSLADHLRRAVRAARDAADRDGLAFIEVEVDTLEQLQAILAAGKLGIHIVLLDNMNPDQLRRAVDLRNAWAATNSLAPDALLLEASGGITLDSLPAIAATGVDRVSLGTLTHGATWLDFGLDIDND